MTYKCPFCNKQYNLMWFLSRHIRVEHSNPDRCPLCGVKVNNLVMHAAALKRSKQHWALYALLSSRHKLKNVEEALSILQNSKLWNFGIGNDKWEVRIFNDGFIVRRYNHNAYFPFDKLPTSDSFYMSKIICLIGIIVELLKRRA